MKKLILILGLILFIITGYSQIHNILRTGGRAYFLGAGNLDTITGVYSQKIFGYTKDTSYGDKELIILALGQKVILEDTALCQWKYYLCPTYVNYKKYLLLVNNEVVTKESQTIDWTKSLIIWVINLAIIILCLVLFYQSSEIAGYPPDQSEEKYQKASGLAIIILIVMVVLLLLAPKGISLLSWGMIATSIIYHILQKPNSKFSEDEIVD